MASFTPFSLITLTTLLLCHSLFAAAHGQSQSLSFRLAAVRKARGSSPPSTRKPAAAAFRQSRRGPSDYSGNYSSTFKYTMALVLSMPIGTPPQKQSMVLDTGSQLSWINCNQTIPKPTPHRPHPPRPFNFSSSSSFVPIACKNQICTPRIPDSSLYTSCDRDKAPCRYSLFYADGTPGAGNLVKEVFSLNREPHPTNDTRNPLVTIGCAENTNDTEGILGMNRDNLSFTTQAGIRVFSYCVPLRREFNGTNNDGAFHLGPNPSGSSFNYTYLLHFTESQMTVPNLDKFAYTVNMTGIRIAGNPLGIDPAVFVPDSSGSGQTMIDSGTEYTYLVDDAYNRIATEVAARTAGKLRRRAWTDGGLEMCFHGIPAEIGRVVGNMTFAFADGAEIRIPEERMADEVQKNLSCLGIASSGKLGVPSNIIGNFHQQNLWVEFDLNKFRVGFGQENCSAVL